MRLTIEKVSQAIAELKAQNQKPTNRAIIKHLGYGSFSTLAKLRQTHPEVFAPDISSSRVPDNANTIMEQFWPLLDARLTEFEERLSLPQKKEAVHPEATSTEQSDTNERIAELIVENKCLKTVIAKQDDDIQFLQKEMLQLRRERDETLDITASQQEQLAKNQANLEKLTFQMQTLQDENAEIVKQANGKWQQLENQKKALEQERAYADSLRQEIKALKVERDQQREIESEQLRKAVVRIAELEVALAQVEKQSSSSFSTHSKTVSQKIGKTIEGEALEVEIESTDNESKEELIQRFEEYLNAEWNEKQEREIALYNSIRVWLAYKWPHDLERLQNTILEINTNSKRYVAVALSTSITGKPYVVHCLVLSKIQDSFHYTLIRKRKEYVLEKAAHKKASEWLNDFND